MLGDGNPITSPPPPSSPHKSPQPEDTVEVQNPRAHPTSATSPHNMNASPAPVVTGENTVSDPVDNIAAAQSVAGAVEISEEAPSAPPSTSSAAQHTPKSTPTSSANSSPSSSSKKSKKKKTPLPTPPIRPDFLPPLEEEDTLLAPGPSANASFARRSGSSHSSAGNSCLGSVINDRSSSDDYNRGPGPSRKLGSPQPPDAHGVRMAALRTSRHGYVDFVVKNRPIFPTIHPSKPRDDAAKISANIM
ncbi:hypothetical protein HK097_002512, partial [Rhizophlyctis rosea]